jgi:PilZ domain
MPFIQAFTWVAKAFRERRRSLREPVRYTALIDVGEDSLPHHCAVLDISEDGARLLLTASCVALPEEFSLVFTRYGIIRRRCRVVWRSGAEVGIAYLGPLECENPPDADDASLRPH